jgi:hypothetical protein
MAHVSRKPTTEGHYRIDMLRANPSDYSRIHPGTTSRPEFGYRTSKDGKLAGTQAEARRVRGPTRKALHDINVRLTAVVSGGRYFHSLRYAFRQEPNLALDPSVCGCKASAL